MGFPRIFRCAMDVGAMEYNLCCGGIESGIKMTVGILIISMQPDKLSSNPASPGYLGCSNLQRVQCVL